MPKYKGCTKGIACKHAPLNKHTDGHNIVQKQQPCNTNKLQVQKQSSLNKDRDLVKQKMAKRQPEKNWYSYL